MQLKAPCVAHRYTGQGGQSKKGDQVAFDSIRPPSKEGETRQKQLELDKNKKASVEKVTASPALNHVANLPYRTPVAVSQLKPRS